MGFAQYSQVDEYGRVFTPIVSYGLLLNVARAYRPSGKDCSTYPVVTPLLLCSCHQNQELYQYDEE